MSSFLSLTPAADDYGVGGREGRGEERGGRDRERDRERSGRWRERRGRGW